MLGGLRTFQALPLLKAAYDRGINTWDTAGVYSNGESERIIGKALKQYQIPRHKVVLMTKCFNAIAEEPALFTPPHLPRMLHSKEYVNQALLSRQAIFNAVNASLERLGTEYIDLLQAHRFDYYTPIEETMEALNDLVRMGKVRYIGASTMWTYQFAMMQSVAEQRGWTKFISMQNHYSLLYREGRYRTHANNTGKAVADSESEEREMNKYCAVTGVGIIPWSPLGRGHLARPRAQMSDTVRGRVEAGVVVLQTGNTEADIKIAARVEEIAKKKGWPMSHVALAWLNRRICSPVMGLNKIERLDEAAAVRGKVLTEDEEKYLEEPYEPRDVEALYTDDTFLLTKKEAPWLVR